MSKEGVRSEKQKVAEWTNPEKNHGRDRELRGTQGRTTRNQLADKMIRTDLRSA